MTAGFSISQQHQLAGGGTMDGDARHGGRRLAATGRQINQPGRRYQRRNSGILGKLQLSENWREQAASAWQRTENPAIYGGVRRLSV